MASPPHLAVVKSGAQALAKWRTENPGTVLDLSGSNLSNLDFQQMDLSGADLSGSKAYAVSFSRSDLSGANLSNVSFQRANFSGCNLARANFTKGNFLGAMFFGANLTAANLIEANLGLCDFMAADLTDARLVGANLFGTRFNNTKVKGTDFARAHFNETQMTGCDIRTSKNLETAVHDGPSDLGFDVTYRSLVDRAGLTPELLKFFTNAGVSKGIFEVFGDIMSVDEESPRYLTSFICYGAPDQLFAERLASDMKAMGASTWLYSFDRTPGERTWSEIGKRRREADRMIVMCSASSLVREGALKEIEEQIDEDPEKLIPVSLDDLWKERGFRIQRGERDLKPFLLERNYVDFAHMKYEDGLEQLLSALVKN